MKLFRHSSFALVFTVAVLALSGCGNSDTPTSNANPAHIQESEDANPAAPTDADEITSEGSDAGNDGRAFDSGDDTIIQVIEQTFKSDNAVATWKDGVLHIALDGSAEAITAYIPCSAAETVLADGEEVILEYPDGEYVCAERPGR